MNPELQRNLWLEVAPRRVVFMLVVLGLIFLAARTVGGTPALRLAAEYAFYAIAVIWGARNAAQSVVGEIRERTWDSQRLGALTPFAMTWGKLFGATSFAWLGGAACLAVLVGIAFVAEGIVGVFSDLCYFLCMGLMAQAVALFASLIAVRRRQGHSRLDVLFYQMAGLAAAWAVWFAWQFISSPEASSLRADFTWWAIALDIGVFYLVSLFLFLGWAFIGCYRLMRAELQVQNSPAVWTAFILFMAVYTAGFDSGTLVEADWFAGDAAGRLRLAAAALAALTYAAALFEPKDLVLYRWLADALARSRLREALPRLQGWMIAYGATALAVLSYVLLRAGDSSGPAMLSALGFLTRDIAIFFLFQLLPGRRRGEVPALVTLAVLYGILPQLGGVPPLDNPVFYPVPAGWYGSLIAWLQAGAIWGAIVALERRRSPRGAIRGAER